MLPEVNHIIYDACVERVRGTPGWENYEQSKARLRHLNLSPKEFEKALTTLCEALEL